MKKKRYRCEIRFVPRMRIKGMFEEKEYSDCIIRIKKSLDTKQRFITLLHELAHWAIFIIFDTKDLPKEHKKIRALEKEIARIFKDDLASTTIKL